MTASRTKEILHALADLTMISYLDLRLCKVSSDDFRSLPDVRGANRLALPFDVTPQGIQFISKHEDIKSVVLIGQEISDNHLAALASIDSIVEVELITCYKVSDTGIDHLKRLKWLKGLSFQGVDEITGRGFDILGSLPLKFIQYRDANNVSDRTLSYLKGLGLLQHLGLINADVSDNGLAHLTSLKNLTWLELGGTSNNTSYRKLFESLSMAQSLGNNLWSPKQKESSITDAGLTNLQGLVNLEFLGISTPHVSIQGIISLKKFLPNLRVVDFHSSKQYNNDVAKDISNLRAMGVKVEGIRYPDE